MDLHQMSKRELLAMAEARKIEVDPKATKTALVEALDCLTPEELETLQSASLSKLMAAVGDDGLPGYLRRGVQVELEKRRKAHEAELAKRAAKTSPRPIPQPAKPAEPVELVSSPEPVVQQYEVIKGTQVVIGDFLSTIETGSVVSAQTHDIKLLVDSGVTLRPIKGVQVWHDELGFPRTRVIQ